MLRIFDSQRYFSDEVFAIQSASTFASTYSVNATTENAVGLINSKSTCKTVVAAATQNAVVSINSKSTCKTTVVAFTQNAVGLIVSDVIISTGCSTQVNAFTQSAVGLIMSNSVCKTSIFANTQNAVGNIKSKVITNESPVVIILDSKILTVANLDGDVKRISQNDVGTEILLDCGIDISSATLYKIRARKPDFTIVLWDATLGDIDTQVKYITQSGDIDIAGEWKLQAAIEMPNWSGSGEVTKLTVNEIL